MNNFTKKLELIFVPFLLIAVCVIGGYTFLNWLLVIKLHVVTLNEEIPNLWIPMTLPWIPIIVWLRPKIKLLNLKRKKGDLPGLYICIAGFAIAAPTIIAQSYLETASGKLTQLENISQIKKQEATKFYTLNHYYIDKSHIGVKSTFDVSGKSSQYFNMKLYLSLPILVSPDDTLNSTCPAWYGVKYTRQISNRLDQNEKEEQFRKFAQESQEDFDTKDIREFVYFDRIGNTDDHKGYMAAIKNDKSFSGDGRTVLVPVNEPFEKRNGNKLPWIFGSLVIGAAIWLIMIAIPKFDEVELNKFNSGTVEKSTAIKDSLQFFLPRKGFFITAIIMDLNILVFLVMVFSGLGLVSFTPTDLVAWGGNFKPLTTNGEWWRLLTNIFLHGGLMHLFANMCGLLFVGILLEPRLDRTKYAIAYLVTGIIASIASLEWHKATVSVGASGAIFGLYGVFLALIVTKAFPKESSRAFLASTLFFVGYNLVAGLAGQGIDNAAHIGGLISGFIIGLIYSPQLNRVPEHEQSVLETSLQNSEEPAKK